METSDAITGLSTLKIHVLHVDDEPGIAELTKAYLEMKNDRFVVDTSISVTEALEKLGKIPENEKYDAIVSDYQMPDRNGLEFLELLRKRGDNIPFIVFIGKSRQEVAIKALNLGANRYLRKGGDSGSQFGVLARVIVSEVENRRIRQKNEKIIQIQRDLGISLSSTTDLLEALNLILEATLRIDGIDCGGIYLVDNVSHDLDLVVSKGLSRQFIESASFYDGSSPQARLIMKGKPVFMRHTELPVEIAENRLKEGLRFIAIIPVLYEGQVIAAINCSSFTHDVLSGSDLKALETIATQIGGVIARTRAEKLIRESQKDLQTVFDTMEEMLFILDMHGSIIHVNRAAQETLGYSAEELVGKNILEIPPPDLREEATNIGKQMIAGNTSLYYVPLMTSDGQLISIETRVVKGKWSGQDALIGISRDITGLQRIEEALRNSEERYRADNEN